MKNQLKIGDTVNWRGNRGKDPVQQVEVDGIEINCSGKEGEEVDSVDWDLVKDESVIVNLTCCKWAYGYQISKI